MCCARAETGVGQEVLQWELPFDEVRCAAMVSGDALLTRDAKMLLLQGDMYMYVCAGASCLHL